MKQNSITIKDIAKALNLSHSTVARALKDSYKISKETTHTVKEYAEKNGYRPNLFAQSLRTQNSRTIGVLLCSIPNNFFAEVINGIESIATSKNYYVIILQSHESYENEIKNLKNLDSRSIDGLLVSLSSETKDIAHFEAIHKNGLPIVFFDRVTHEINTHTVETENVKATFDLTRHLIESGFTRIAHIGSCASLAISQDRLKGYVQALTKYGLPVEEHLVRFCEHGGMLQEEVDMAVSALLDTHTPPDAILTTSDRITIKTFHALKERGILIPQQIALAGYSNFSSPDLFNPSLTTIVQPAFEMGLKATELLIQLIESKKPVEKFQKIILPNKLIMRESSKKY